MNQIACFGQSTLNTLTIFAFLTVNFTVNPDTINRLTGEPYENNA